MTEENAIPNWLKMGLAILGAAWLTWAGLDGLTTEGAHLRGGRGGPWELKVVVMFVGAAALVAYFFWVGFQKSAVVAVGEDRLEHPKWKQPMLFDQIQRVTTERFSPISRGETLAIHLRDGTVQYLPSNLLPAAPRTFAKRLQRAVEGHRTAAPSR